MRMLTFNSKNCGGGSIIKLIELITGLSNSDWEVNYIAPKNFKNNGYIKHYKIFQFSNFTGFFYIVQITIISLYLMLIQYKKIDRIVTFSILEGVVACLMSKISKKTKVVVSVRGDWHTGVQLAKWNDLYKKVYIRLFLILERYVFDNSDLIIFVSKENCSRICSRTTISKQKVKIIYNSVINPRTLKISDVQSIPFKEDTVFGFLGNLHAKDKGVEVLIKAYYLIIQRNVNTKLIIIGNGPDRKYLEELCESLQIEENVLFTGFLENPFPYIKSFDIMVHPSLHEGFSGAILEGLYCDKVVIGSKTGGIIEALLYEELLFDPTDVMELASRMEELLNEESYKKAFKLCQSRKSKFSFDWIQEMEKAIKLLK